MEAARRVALVALSRARAARRLPHHPTAQSPSCPTTQAARHSRHTHPLQRCGVGPDARWLYALPVSCGAQLFMRRARRPHDKRTVCFGTTRATKIITRSSSTLHQGVPRASRKLEGRRSRQGGGKGHYTSWPLSCTAIQSTCCLHVGQALEHLVNHGRMQSAQYQ